MSPCSLEALLLRLCSLTSNPFQTSNNGGTCRSEGALKNLLEDIFMGNEVIPDVLDAAPLYPLDLTYKTIRTFPGMKLTADATRYG